MSNPEATPEDKLEELASLIRELKSAKKKLKDVEEERNKQLTWDNFIRLGEQFDQEISLNEIAVRKIKEQVLECAEDYVNSLYG